MRRLRTTPLWWLVATTAALGCATERGDSQVSSGVEGVARQWDCAEEASRITCTAPIAAAQDESGAYACLDGDEHGVCPPHEALGEIVDALDDGDVETFARLPWACLLTGEHQRHCIKDLEVAGSGDIPGDPGGSEPDPDRTPDEDPPGPASAPTIPTDCVPDSWEPYFCELATFKYRGAGVNITFPCEIFDANASFDSTLPGVPSGSSADPDLPSCHDGEWGMRDQSWLDAVLRGCLNLNDPILVMCQQAANYAPASGACRATGTW